MADAAARVEDLCRYAAGILHTNNHPSPLRSFVAPVDDRRTNTPVDHRRSRAETSQDNNVRNHARAVYY